MKKQSFTGSTVEECIKNACMELSIKEEELKYEVVYKKTGLFRKKAEILVELEEKNSNQEENEKSSSNGTVTILNGQIQVKDPINNGKQATINIPGNINVSIDGVQVSGRKEINSSSVVEVSFKTIEKPQRILKISVSPDKSEAYLDIEYVNKKELKLKDQPEANSIFLESEVINIQASPVYTESEIVEELKKQNIVYGIVRENLKKCTAKEGVRQLLIARGLKVKDDEDDILEIKFDVSNGNKYKENKAGNIDFKSIGFVSSVSEGSVMATRREGAQGHDGKDIYGNDIKRKSAKKLQLAAGDGCELRGEDTVVALKSGKAEFKTNRFTVVDVYDVNSDVDLKTGNIKFNGAVNIMGSVLEGMKVESENDIIVQNNVEGAELKAKGDITVGKNAILSKIYSGGEDVNTLGKIEVLNNVKKGISEIIDAVYQIKKYNANKNFSSDGEIIKILLESKFKSIPKICKNYIELANDPNEKFVKIFNEKFLGIAPVYIKQAEELNYLDKEIENEIESLNSVLTMPASINITYCQDCTIQSSGNINITGKGEYISNIIANNSINFLNKDAVARGGFVRAKDEIRCGVVGSIGGVVTKLAVAPKGHIYAEIAYPNTVFIVGNRETTIENPSKNIHVYIDHHDELVVDKLLL
ncbi:flagellar assembly protein A [Clostridium hydrogenum]|uniref:flagellar assembly protein A n=1 Tax=Clostridium hydrogenum TaxID=2855764 RepID=UPI001F3922FF|nr:flagellar assembly protein A [Clostridium hydrogenum]